MWENSQPPFVNSIYEAVDDDGPKSYRKRLPAVALGTGDLTIFQGPLLLVPSLNPLRLFLEIEDGNIHPAKPTTPRRVDRWIRANVHLPAGRTGCSSRSSATPPAPTRISWRRSVRTSTPRSRIWNGATTTAPHYVLHYVTAREAYNLARAAAAGQARGPFRVLRLDRQAVRVERSPEHCARPATLLHDLCRGRRVCAAHPGVVDPAVEAARLQIQVGRRRRQRLSGSPAEKRDRLGPDRQPLHSAARRTPTSRLR